MPFTSDEQHPTIPSPAALKLAKIHWYVLKSSSLMDELCCETVPEPIDGLFTFREYRSTNFGKEVGRDEIDWWINQKEANLDVFVQRSKAALEAAQILKLAATKLKGTDPDSYEELLTTLMAFTEGHSPQIDTLYDYVRWLYSRDRLAPSILFTYKVWGTTRRSDRTVTLSSFAETPEDES